MQFMFCFTFLCTVQNTWLREYLCAKNILTWFYAFIPFMYCCKGVALKNKVITSLNGSSTFCSCTEHSLEVSGLHREVFRPLMAHSEQSYSCCELWWKWNTFQKPLLCPFVNSDVLRENWVTRSSRSHETESRP